MVSSGGRDTSISNNPDLGIVVKCFRMMLTTTKSRYIEIGRLITKNNVFVFRESILFASYLALVQSISVCSFGECT